MASPGRKVPAKDFKVSFFADEAYLFGHLGLWFLLFGLALVGFWGFGWVYKSTTFGLFVSVLSVGLAILSVQIMIYILVLLLWSGTVFSLDRRGLRDHASFCMVGYILMDDILRIYIKDTLLGSFVVVSLKPGSRALSKRSLVQKVLSWWVLKLCPDSLVIPMGVIDVSRMNLETQFSHFAAVLREFSGGYENNSSSAGSASLSGSRFSRNFHIPDNPAETVGASEASKRESFQDPDAEDIELTVTSLATPEESDSDEASGVHYSTLVIDEGISLHEDTFIPPVVTPSMSEKTVLIRQVEALKGYVTKKKIDFKLCDAFGDFISHFPHWSISQDPRIPSSVADIRAVSNTGDYEEVAFTYRGKAIGFSLRRDIGPAELALLSMSYQGKVRVSLRVSVEIGAFEPDRIEVYHRGSWEKVFLSFYEELMGESLEAESLFVKEATEVDIADLRENFGINRPGDEE